MRYLIIICLFLQVFTLSAFGQSYKYHTVAAGETVFSIAKDYNLTPDDIYKYNPDAKNGIQLGAKIVVPLQPEASASSSSSSETTGISNEAVTFRTHRVKKQETLYGLSKLYEVDIEDIKRYNTQLYAKELQMGDMIRIPVYADSDTSGMVTPANKDVIPNGKPAPVLAANPSKQTAATREHIVIPKETKYGIARKYGMTVEELEKMNPTVEVLQPGVMIKVGTDVLDEPVIILDDNFKFYEVQPKDNLFRLTRRFQIETDSLIALNPALKEGLKFGMVLKVPAKESENPNDLSFTKSDFDPANSKNMNLETMIKDRSIKNIVLMLPYNLSKVKKDSTSNARQVLENDRVMRISLDFYTGVMMAVERGKELGISTNLRVYDTQQQPTKVSGIIAGGNFSNVDAVIGPLLQTTSEEAATRLTSLNVPVISPMSNRDLRAIPNLYQARPSDEMLSNAMIDYLQQTAQDKNVIIVADASNYSIKNKLTAALPSAKVVNPGTNNITEGTLAQALVKGKENIVVLESESVALLSAATSALNRLARNNQITLYTTNKNSSFENDVMLNEHLGNLNFHFPSEYREFDESGSDRFVDNYEEKYGVIPNKYAVRGYDLTLDVLLRLAAMGSIENSVNENVVTEYVENKFMYRPKTNGGFYNDAVYIMQFNKDLSVSVVK